MSPLTFSLKKAKQIQAIRSNMAQFLSPENETDFMIFIPNVLGQYFSNSYEISKQYKFRSFQKKIRKDVYYSKTCKLVNVRLESFCERGTDC